MSDNSNDLLRMPGDTSTSAGERNPELLRNLANDLAPYYSTFAGSQTIPDVGHFGQRAELADMYSVLATDPDAGVTAAQHTYAQELALAFDFGHGAGDAPSTNALIPGQMQDALENGTATAATTMDRADVYEAAWRTAVENAEWNTGVIAASAVATAIPGAGVAAGNLIYLAGPSLTTDMVGVVDTGAVIDPNNSVANQEAQKVFNPVRIAEHMVNGYIANDPSVVNHPLLKDLKTTDPATGDTYIDVHNNAGQLQNVIDVLESRGVRVNDWFNWFNTGTNSGAMVVSER